MKKPLNEIEPILQHFYMAENLMDEDVYEYNKVFCKAAIVDSWPDDYPLKSMAKELADNLLETAGSRVMVDEDEVRAQYEEYCAQGLYEDCDDDDDEYNFVPDPEAYAD